MLNFFSREKAEPVQPRSYRSDKYFSFCSDRIYPHSLSSCSPRKKLGLPLCNIDLKKWLSPQVWPNVNRAYFSLNTLDASLLVLKFPKYPFLNFSSGRSLILHLGRITRRGGQSPVLTLRNQGRKSLSLAPSAPPSKRVGPPGALGSHEARRGWSFRLAAILLPAPVQLLNRPSFQIDNALSFVQDPWGRQGPQLPQAPCCLKLICVCIHSINVTFELIRNTESLAPLRGTESESAFWQDTQVIYMHIQV